MNPNLFWSASEDGTVRQFDKRCRCCALEHHGASSPMAGRPSGSPHPRRWSRGGNGQYCKRLTAMLRAYEQ